MVWRVKLVQCVDKAYVEFSHCSIFHVRSKKEQIRPAPMIHLYFIANAPLTKTALQRSKKTRKLNQNRKCYNEILVQFRLGAGRLLP